MSPLAKQTHYADLDTKWLNENGCNHIDNELFNVPYAVVDRAAMASGAPQLAVVMVTSSNTASKWLICSCSLLLLHV